MEEELPFEHLVKMLLKCPTPSVPDRHLLKGNALVQVHAVPTLEQFDDELAVGRSADTCFSMLEAGSAPRDGPRQMLERYGMTETNMNTSNPYDGERIPGSVGFPLPGVEIRIADPQTGRVLPQGEVGVIEIRGPNVFKGYWHMPEKTKKEFREDGFFKSGDLGRIDERGYFYIVG